MIRYLSQTEVVMRLGVDQVAALLGDGVWPRMLVFGPDEQEEAVSDGPWETGDPEPSGVRVVLDSTEDRVSDIANSDVWKLTSHGTWEGWKGDRWVYLPWDELVERWGPVMLP